jgi:hypothetical protein
MEAFDSILSLSGAAPMSIICVKRLDAPVSAGLSLQILDMTPDQIRMRSVHSPVLMSAHFTGGLPSRTALSGLNAGTHYRLSLTVTDGNTVPVTATSNFLYQGEQWLVFDRPPAAAIAGGGSVECAGPAGTPVSLDGSASSDPDSTPGTNDDIASFAWYENYGAPGERLLGSAPALAVTLPLGTHALTLKVTDRAGESGVATTAVTVADTQPPLVDCPAAPAAAECEGALGAYVALNATARDACGGVTLTNDQTAGGGDASGPYRLGATTVSFTATDAAGHQATCASLVTVRDTQPPTLTVYPDPTVLWPPNHGLVPVHLRLAALDRCDPSPRALLVSVTSSEPDDAAGNGDGATVNDVQDLDPGAADTDILLRSERDGKGPGRVYTLTYRAVDAAGNQAPGLTTVTVPRDQGHGPEPLLMQLAPMAPGSTTVRIVWPTVSDATGYNVISGSLSALHVEDGVLNLGAVRVLARGTQDTTVDETTPAANPQVGQGFFYLIEQVTSEGAVGYGTESAPWPRVPGSCDGGCPGVVIAGGAGGGTGGGTTRR